MPITQNTVIIAVINPQTEALIYKEAQFGLDGNNVPIPAVEAKLKSNLPLIAIFDGRIQGSDDFWVVTEGNNLASITADADGNVDIKSHDASGQGSTRVRRLNANGTAEAPRSLSSKVSQAAMGGGATMDFWNDGTGTDYKNKVNEAIAHINVTYQPRNPIPPVS